MGSTSQTCIKDPRMRNITVHELAWWNGSNWDTFIRVDFAIGDRGKLARKLVTKDSYIWMMGTDDRDATERAH